MAQPIEPRRFKKRWAFLILLLLVMGLMIGGHWIWTIGAGRRVTKLVATYRAAGQPIEPDDFRLVGVVGGENAVDDLRAAARAIDQTTDAWKAYEQSRDIPALPLRPQELEQIRAVLAGNPKALELLTSASKRPGVNWRLAWKTPVINILLPDLNTQRTLANFAMADALIAHTDGDHARAVQRAQEILFQSRVVGHQPTLVSHLVSIGLAALATELSEQLAEDVRVGGGPGEASPQQVRELIAALLDDTSSKESQRLAMLGERMMQLDSARPGHR
jgi:hypothetical protein